MIKKHTIEGQRILDKTALSNFRTEEGVAEEVMHFKALSGFDFDDTFMMLDIGGGVGHFVDELSKYYLNATSCIWDIDENALKNTSEKFDSLFASILDDSAVSASPKYDVVSMNLMLHHIVGENSLSTDRLQEVALENARKLLKSSGLFFLHEICYQGRIYEDFPGRLIYLITSNDFLSQIASMLSRFAPSLKANTFGVGVGFRSMKEWESRIKKTMFIKGVMFGNPEGHSILRRCFLNISSVRRGSLMAINHLR